MSAVPPTLNLMAHDDTPTTHLPMVCDCGENKFAADALMGEVLERLSRGRSNFIPRPVTMDTFLTDVLRSLTHDLGGNIEHILCDQWFLVKADRITATNDDEDVVVQCDRPEYCIAAIWRHWANQDGLATDRSSRDRRPASLHTSPSRSCMVHARRP